jgi:hypothetical protein
MSQIVRTIGKARLTIRVEGCVDCGSAFSAAWVEERRHQIIIGDRREYISLYKCARCAGRNGASIEHDAPTALQRRQQSEAAHDGTIKRFAQVR